jgi:predicted alpha/beta superfamily hydrolase
MGIVALIVGMLVSTITGAADAPRVSIPRTAFYDITSKGNGEVYRVMVAVPPGYDANKAYPAIYVLEGNVYFGTAVEALERQANFEVAAPAIVVSIGYPSDDPQEQLTRRWYDLTPTRSEKEKRRNGGGDVYLKFLEEEVKPLVFGRYNVDKERQALWGQSNGGLMVMRAMFRNPEAYSAYLVSSPNIGWDDSVVLKDEAAFMEQMKKPGKPIALMVSYGSDDYPPILKSTSAWSARLRESPLERVKLHLQVFEGENHITVSHTALVRALRFALPP